MDKPWKDFQRYHCFLTIMIYTRHSLGLQLDHCCSCLSEGQTSLTVTIDPTQHLRPMYCRVAPFALARRLTTTLAW